MGGRVIAWLALAIPVLAGLAYLAGFDAPRRYLAVNAGALVLAGAWIGLAPPVSSLIARRVLAIVLVAALFVPLITGPSLNGVARWIPLGPVQLHAGMLIVPGLAVMAARDLAYAPAMLGSALLAAALQPDMATGFALMLAGVGLYHTTQDWRLGVFATVAFMASLVMAVRGELPAQPFVERVLVTMAVTSPLAALGLLFALLASFLLLRRAVSGGPEAGNALAGSLVGFSIAAVFSNYPSALIGYGAAPILGFGIALGLRGGEMRMEECDRPADSHLNPPLAPL